MIEVVQVPSPSAGEEASALLGEAAGVWRRWHLAFFGHADLTDSAESLAVAYREQGSRAKLVLVALEDGEVVGASWTGMPLRDNTTIGEGDIAVVPGADVPTVTRALWEGLAPRLVAAGRRTMQLWSFHRAAAEDDPSALVPATGVGRLEPDETTRVLLDLGFRLEQVERHSQLDVADALSRADRLEAEALPHAGGYELLTWTGPTPEELRAEMAEVMGHMATDVPSGDFELEAEDWDADRVADADRVTSEMGRVRVTTVARHRASGRLVGYTILDHPRDKPAVSYQEDTLVVREHRGHRLGMLVKIRNLRTLAEHLPHVERLHTWNAGENEHMLAINQALGFRDVSAEGGWQLRRIGSGTGWAREEVSGRESEGVG